VGQYVATERDALRDDGRTDLPIYFFNGSTYTRAIARSSNGFRADWLFSYQPTPGTVLFAGYGSTLVEPAARRMFGLDALQRRQDGFFVKLSYLFRL
jgi:hypothetical protein